MFLHLTFWMGLFYFEFCFVFAQFCLEIQQDRRRQGISPVTGRTLRFCHLIIWLLFMLCVGFFFFFSSLWQPFLTNCPHCLPLMTSFPIKNLKYHLPLQDALWGKRWLREICLRSSDPHTILSGRGGVKMSYVTFLTPVYLIKSFCCFELSREKNQKIKRRPCGQARTWLQLLFFFLFFLLDCALKCSRAGSSVHPLWGHEMNRW